MPECQTVGGGLASRRERASFTASLSQPGHFSWPITGILTFSEVMKRLRAEVHDAFPSKTASTSVTTWTG